MAFKQNNKPMTEKKQNKLIIKLCSSIYKDDIDSVRKILPKVVDINRHICLPPAYFDTDEHDEWPTDDGYDGLNALHVAVYNFNFKIIKLLLESGADVNIFSKKNLLSTPLQIALYKDDYDLELSLEIVKILLLYGANIYSRTNNIARENSLMLACSNGNIEIVKEILKFKPGLYNHDNDEYLLSFLDNDDKLMLKKKYCHKKKDSETEDIDNKQLELTTIFCDDNQWYSVFLELESREGYTAFALAIHYGNLELATMLADYGANINVHINNVGTPFMDAINIWDFEYNNVIEWFINRANFAVKDDEKNKVFIVMVKFGNLKFIKWSIDTQGADKNYANEDGDTALHIAAYNNNLDVCLFLISIGMDPNLKNKQNLSALMNYGENHHYMLKEEKQARKEQLIEARANYLELQQREDRWQRRKNALMTKTDLISEKKINFDTFCQIVKYL
uniref:Uncharacterized protein n=1 Tax=viral metagenome TaxID=1070528 RepID=A0A6C0D8Q8_9ZZZZ